MTFVEQWEEYLDNHPAIRKIIDPEYVVFDFSGDVPAAFAADIAATDARAGVVATLRVDNSPSTSMFLVANHRMALMFAGRMRALHPGVFATVFTSTTLTCW